MSKRKLHSSDVEIVQVKKYNIFSLFSNFVKYTREVREYSTGKLCFAKFSANTTTLQMKRERAVFAVLWFARGTPNGVYASSCIFETNYRTIRSARSVDA